MKRMFVVQNQVDLERCYPVLIELRPHLSFENLVSTYNEAHVRDGYELVAIEEQGKILAVMGYRFLSDFVRGKHVYIDDLVSTASARSLGLGAELLEFAEGVARDSGCESLRLCAVMENERGIKFYEAHGWAKRAFAFTKKLIK